MFEWNILTENKPVKRVIKEKHKGSKYFRAPTRKVLNFLKEEEEEAYEREQTRIELEEIKRERVKLQLFLKNKAKVCVTEDEVEQCKDRITHLLIREDEIKAELGWVIGPIEIPPVDLLARVYKPKRVTTKKAAKTWMENSKLGGLRMTVEPFIEGVSVTLVYKRGRLARIVNTEAGGIAGADITQVYKYTPGILEILGEPSAGKNFKDPYSILEVQGVIYLNLEGVNSLGVKSYDAVKRYNINPIKYKDYLKYMGFVATDTSDIAEIGFAYELLGIEDPDFKLASYELHRRLKNTGFDTTSPLDLEKSTYRNIDRNLTLLRRFFVNYPVKGFVFKIADVLKREEMKEESDTCDWALELDISDALLTGEVLRFSPIITNDGLIRLHVDIHPVLHKGVYVQRVLLTDISGAVSSGIGVGSFVGLSNVKSSSMLTITDVITIAPKVYEGVKTECPFCLSALLETPRPSGKIEYSCKKAARCPGVTRTRLKRFLSKDFIGIKELLSERALDTIAFRMGYMPGPYDIYSPEFKDAVTYTYPEEVAHTIFKKIDLSVDLPLSTLLYGLRVFNTKGRSSNVDNLLGGKLSELDNVKKVPSIRELEAYINGRYSKELVGIAKIWNKY